jgi:DNA-binding MarR family transcriptional regulator
MHLGRLLRRPAMILHEEVHKRLEEHGYGDVKMAHGAVLSYIGDGAQITQMAQLALTSKQNMSYLVDYLEKKGYVVAQEHGSDGRAKMFRLTKKGNACRKQAVNIINDITTEWQEKIGKKKMQQLQTLLLELNDQLEGGIPLYVKPLKSRFKPKG